MKSVGRAVVFGAVLVEDSRVAVRTVADLYLISTPVARGRHREGSQGLPFQLGAMARRWGRDRLRAMLCTANCGIVGMRHPRR